MFASSQQVTLTFQNEWADLRDIEILSVCLMRLLIATLLGALIGIERARVGRAAGPRTHMLVTLAAALFVLLPVEAGFDSADTSRVIQGILAGIGFIGGGAILKLTSEKEVLGLTTAADIWLASAIGIAAGLGKHGLALIGTALALAILRLVPRRERDAEN
jgi:putative Mg2+ transporter-C (MgtC) family protein